ncbi:MAG TPA: cupin domain-containing protein [Alphaproteobacteria bacterium]|nr:cupin domain-containing protein [Alphaproteobacteria bacterium]
MSLSDALSLTDEIERRVARYAERRDDWTVFGFETAIDERYARSQRRYIGASGSVDHEETNAVEPVAFTMSIQTMPPGNRIPVHCHETEETFFILQGSCVVNVFRGDESVSVRLGLWDLISVPAFTYHDIHNDGTGPCAVQTLLSKPRPDRPHYRDAVLLDLQAKTYTR